MEDIFKASALWAIIYLFLVFIVWTQSIRCVITKLQLGRRRRGTQDWEREMLQQYNYCWNIFFLFFFFGIWEDYVSFLKSGNICNITMFYYHYKRKNATTVGIGKNCVVAACGKTYLEYQSLVIFMIYLPKIFFLKSRIQETLNLSTDADRSTDTFFLLALPYGLIAFFF